METPFCAVIAAGGSGSRLKSETPKQFMKMGGLPIVLHSAETFLECKSLMFLVVVTPASWVGKMTGWLLDKRAFVTTGGTDRQASVFAGLKCLNELLPSRDIPTLIHDAARPFVTRSLIEDTVSAVVQFGAAIAAVRTKDTVKITDIKKGVRISVESPDRNTVYLAQTPQGFRFDDIYNAHKLNEGQGQAYDDAYLAELNGLCPVIVQGDYNNIKITTQEDLKYAEFLTKSLAVNPRRMH